MELNKPMTLKRVERSCVVTRIDQIDIEVQSTNCICKKKVKFKEFGNRGLYEAYISTSVTNATATSLHLFISLARL